MSNNHEDNKLALQSALFSLTDKQPFYGGLLQELTMKYSGLVPTAGLTYNKTKEQFEVHINPEFFSNIGQKEKIALLHHEILHFTNQHVFRFPMLNASQEDRALYNVAGDMAINQYLEYLPEGAVNVKDFKKDDGSDFPLYRAMEEYYELIKSSKQSKQQAKQFVPYDEHNWDDLTEEQKQKMYEEAKKVIERTIEKTNFSHSSLPDGIPDLLRELQAICQSLNYKEILRKTIKKTVCFTDRATTWKRPNRRYNELAPGTKIGNLPKCFMYADTSGSISHTELNEFLGIISNFLRVGTKECKLGLWHTNLYSQKRYKLNDDIKQAEIESGGTDVRCVLENIKRHRPDLAIILTDLYFDMPTEMPDTEIIWIVSKGGNKNHNFPKEQKVIYLENLA